MSRPKAQSIHCGKYEVRVRAVAWHPKWGGVIIPWVVWDSEIRDQDASASVEDSDLLVIKMVVQMLCHFGFEESISEPDIGSYPPDLEFPSA